MKRWLRRYGDIVLAVALATVMTVELVRWVEDDLARAVAVGLLATLPLVLRRVQPVLSGALVMVGLQLLSSGWRGFDNDSGSFVTAYFVALYSVGRHARGREAWLGSVVVVGAMTLFMVGDPDASWRHFGDVVFILVFVGSPWAVGLALRLRQERETVMRARHDALRAEQEEQARRAVTEERSRIARELHDVVSHAIAVTVLQARGARRVLDPAAVEVRRALDAIEQTNTAALGDMRRLLAVLRDTEDGHDGHHPQPTLAHLEDLVRHVDESGVPARLDVTGEKVPVPPGVDLSAYRIIQEALTNVLKHAGAAEVRVLLDYQADALTLRVTDNGRGGSVNGTGHGLIGIRERVAVAGGEVSMGPAPDGGFEVRARLPFALEPA